MSHATPAPAVHPSNPLALPLLIVCVVAVAEAVGLILLAAALARRPDPAAAAAAAAQERGPAGPAVSAGDGKETPARKGADGRGFALGKTGQPVESAGFVITVEQINHEPMYKGLAEYGEDHRYLALLFLVENHTGSNVDLLPANFRLQDDQGYPHRQLGVKLTEPKLGITTLGNGERVRGYLDFIVPTGAKGLKVIYSHTPTRDSQPIHVELGE